MGYFENYLIFFVTDSLEQIAIMNLMFRKNFREQKSGGISSKVGKANVGRHTSKRASREQGYSPMDEHHYRTHLFFSPPRQSYAAEEEDGEKKILNH